MSIHIPSGFFGARLAAIAGLVEPPMELVHSNAGDIFAATRLVAPQGRMGATALPIERAYVLFVRLDEGTSSIVDLRVESTFDFGGTLDMVSVYLPVQSLAHHAAVTGLRFAELAVPAGDFADRQILHLSQCLLASFNGGEGTELFVEGIRAALCTHLLRTLSRAERGGAASGGLAPWQLTRARKLLTADFSDPPNIPQVASTCRLSVSHFTRAFRRSTGTSPHQWLLQQRIAVAKLLLADEKLSLASIALDCGFADQSHFTRVFAGCTGLPPGQWRRSFGLGDEA